ncbi:MAG: hypothetical protein K6C99_03215 [Lachnospiraceae bacterium]|nr:hypothetical protein [Lachnospiraceae bacterium]
MKKRNKDRYDDIRDKVLMYLAVFIVMVTATVFADMHFVHSSDDVEMTVNSTLASNAEYYAGMFSTAVTQSVNPTATLAALSVMGTVENSEIYFDGTEWLEKTAAFLDKVPFIRTAKTLPIANPTAAVVLVLITVTLYVLRSIAAAKAVSEVSLDKIEEILGYITVVALSLLPVASSQVVEAAGKEKNYVTAGTYAALIIIAVICAVINVLIYMIVHTCMDAVEFILTMAPAPGTGVIGQIGKGILHFFLILLQIFAPVISLVLSLLILVACFFLFKYLTRLSIYYTHIYASPLLKKIFGKKEPSKLIHKKLPKSVSKTYPDITMALPVFSMRVHGKIVKKRELLWLADKNPGICLIRSHMFKKPDEITIDSLNYYKRDLYLQKDFRFIRILSEDKTVELIFSSEYGDRFDELLERLRLPDYRIVKDRKSAEQAEKRENVKNAAKNALFGIKKRFSGKT